MEIHFAIRLSLIHTALVVRMIFVLSSLVYSNFMYMCTPVLLC